MEAIQEIQNLDESAAKSAGAVFLVGFATAFVAIGAVKIARFYDEKRFMSKLKKLDKQERKSLTK